ncbi:choline transporter-like protein 1 isoform X2 [Panulirus ornatus]|uniref:choline transporter-like protein 1 isoform X2 n=1 Tax=Panulirus ornatus TaxID=150431 RepID=UPI003A8B60DA
MRKQRTVNGRELAPPGDDTFCGPLHKRVCRDVIFLIIFIAFVIGAIFYLGYVSMEGDTARIIYGHDRYGNVCGQKNEKYFNLDKSGQDFTDKPYLSVGLELGELLDGHWQGLTGTCVARCPANNSTQVGNRCIPIRTDDAAKKFDDITNVTFGITAENFFKTVGQDLGTSWVEIIILCSIALGFAVIVTALLRFLASIVVWLTVIIIVVGSVGGTIYLWVIWHLKNKELMALKASNTASKPLEIDMKETSVRTYLIMAIIATIITVLALILLIAMRNRIRLVIALFNEAGKAVAAMPLILLQPLWTFVWITVVCMVWLLGWLLIESSGIPQKKDDMVIFVRNAFILHMRWYHFFALLWISQFVLACQDVTVAGSIAQWYFTRNKKQLGWPISTAMKRLYRYHLGSVAIGSLIIAIVKFIRYILKHFEKQLNRTNNQACGFLLKCCQCCLWCFEKFLKFLNRNAYIEIAIYGYGFCKAAQKAFSLLVNNAMRVAAINSVGAFVLFLAKAAIVICTGVIGFEILKQKQGLTYFWVPLVVAVIFAYFIAHCFISIYEMTIDTLFLCFCEDCEKNDGIERPYYMSKGLMKFVENSKKAMEAHEFREKQQSVQQVWATNVQPAGSQAYPAQVASPKHIHGGMTPLHPAYPPNSMPPSPVHLTPTSS